MIQGDTSFSSRSQTNWGCDTQSSLARLRKCSRILIGVLDVKIGQRGQAGDETIAFGK